MRITVAGAQDLDEYRQLPDDLVGSSKRWTEWMALERPEDEPLPGALQPRCPQHTPTTRSCCLPAQSRHQLRGPYPFPAVSR